MIEEESRERTINVRVEQIFFLHFFLYMWMLTLIHHQILLQLLKNPH